MTEGAIIIGENLLDEPWFWGLNLIGNWSNGDRLEDPQLEPRASFDGAGAPETGIEFQSQITPPVAYNAIALVGTTIGEVQLPGPYPPHDNYSISCSYTTASEVQISGYSVHEIDSPGTPRTLVILFDEPLRYSRITVRWDPALGGTLGHVILGRAVRGAELADRGWSMQYGDDTSSIRSDGGQVFKGPPSIRRRLSISAGVVSESSAWGVFPVKERVDTEVPASLSGGVYREDGWYKCGPNNQGSVSMASILDFGALYRIDYHQSQVMTPSGTPSFPRWSFSYSSISEQSTGMVTGISSTYGKASSTTLQFACTARPGEAWFKIVGLYKLDAGGWPVRYGSSLPCVRNIAARHGTSRPVVVMIRPSSPPMNQVTGIYGYISDPVRIQHQDADYFRFSMSIEEAL